MIQKRNARFKTHAHAHLVHAHEQQLRQADAEIQVRHPVQMRRLPGLVVKSFVYWLKNVPRRKLAELAPKPGRQDAVLLLLRVQVNPTPEDRLAEHAPVDPFINLLLTPKALEDAGNCAFDGAGERNVADVLDAEPLFSPL